jgi:hypothetical protein
MLARRWCSRFFPAFFAPRAEGGFFASFDVFLAAFIFLDRLVDAFVGAWLGTKLTGHLVQPSAISIAHTPAADADCRRDAAMETG